MPDRSFEPRAVARSVFAFGLAIALAGCGGSKGPNVLLLVMDTTRADRCSFEGYDRPTTPRLDEFAKDAVVFRRAWSPANWTGPAHASLFTGCRPEHHGFQGGARPSLGDDRPTLAERFADAGYDTACFTNNEFVSQEFGLVRGFAKFEPLYRDESRPYPWAKATHERAAVWAEASHAAGRPFFLFINDLEPHQPYAPPEVDALQFARGSPSARELDEARAYTNPRSLAYDLRLEDIDERRLALLSDLYDGEIATLDREIGVLLDRFRSDGLLDTTVVAILGDHGEYLGEHHLIEHSTGAHAAVLHVPMMLRYPGTFDRGRVVADVVRIEDVAPTLLEACGLRDLAGIDGASLTHDLAGRVARSMQPPHDWLTARAAHEFPQADASRLALGIQSVYDGARHLLVQSDGRAELYDPDADPREENDLAAREPDVVVRMRALLTR